MILEAGTLEVLLDELAEACVKTANTVEALKKPGLTEDEIDDQRADLYVLLVLLEVKARMLKEDLDDLEGI
ncbi:MAG: hypothetical protein WCG80_03085 [Spirochaetales bacterium]